MLSKLFSRHRPTPSRFVAPKSIDARPGLPQVIVPQSALDQISPAPDLLVQAVCDFTRAALTDGRYLRDEIPLGAVQAAHVELYRTLVLEGGHARFIAESGSRLRERMIDAGKALLAMGATEFAPIFAAMVKWVRTHPGEAMAHTGGHGQDATELKALDLAFNAANRHRPLHAIMARWIASWPELSPLPDAAAQEALTSLPSLNPEFARRVARAHLHEIANRLTGDGPYPKFGMAALRAEPPELLLSVGAPQMADVAGTSQMMYPVQTQLGDRLATEGDGIVRIYERIEARAPAPLALFGSGNVQAVAQETRRPEAGALLAEISSAEVTLARQIAQRLDAPIRLVALIEQLRQDTGLPFVLRNALLHEALDAAHTRAGEDFLEIVLMTQDAEVFAVKMMSDVVALFRYGAPKAIAPLGDEFLAEYRHWIEAAA